MPPSREGSRRRERQDPSAVSQEPGLRLNPKDELIKEHEIKS
jgi:hypothetical protein